MLTTIDSRKSGGNTTVCLRSVKAQETAPILEDCYRNLAAAVLLQAKKDLAEPGRRDHAVRWLKSDSARHYAEMLGIEPSAVGNLLHRRKGAQ